MIKIFLSHSSQDNKLAEALVDLLQSALRLRAAEIRCTSVDGYRLPGGEDTDEALRHEVLEASVFIGLLSEASVGSAYVLFELGARWGVGKYLVPVLSSGHDASILRGPIAKRNALRCDQASQLHQLIAEVARALHIDNHERELPEVYEKRLRRVLAVSDNQLTSPKHGAMQGESMPGILDSAPIWPLGGVCLLVGALGSAALFAALTAKGTSATIMLLIPSLLLGWALYRASREVIRRLRRKNLTISL